MIASDCYFYAKSKVGSVLRCLFSGGRIKIDSAFYRRGFVAHLGCKDAKIKIGSNCFFNNYCSINSMENIEIGDGCTFGEGVRLYDHDHDFRHKKKEGLPYVTSPIKIGSNVWCGSNVLILKGVSIGDNAVIGGGGA